MPDGVATGQKHRARVLALLSARRHETSEITAALGVTRAVALPSLRALERAGEIVEAERRRRPGRTGPKAIVWQIARP